MLHRGAVSGTGTSTSWVISSNPPTRDHLGKAPRLTLLPCPQPRKHNARGQSLFSLSCWRPYHSDPKTAHKHSTDRANPHTDVNCTVTKSCFCPHHPPGPPGPASSKHSPSSWVLSACPHPSWTKDTFYKAQLLGLESIILPGVLERTRHLLAANIKGFSQLITTVHRSIYAKVEGCLRTLQSEAKKPHR